uniref:Uncharacterized protein n=1 Tax=Timema shepardi TaxID=629360 RepID=A0A7R9AW20_TIMSH|nr:unnamed protein product [Timema shepardi]
MVWSLTFRVDDVLSPDFLLSEYMALGLNVDEIRELLERNEDDEFFPRHQLTDEEPETVMEQQIDEDDEQPADPVGDVEADPVEEQFSVISLTLVVDLYSFFSGTNTFGHVREYRHIDRIHGEDSFLTVCPRDASNLVVGKIILRTSLPGVLMYPAALNARSLNRVDTYRSASVSFVPVIVTSRLSVTAPVSSFGQDAIVSGAKNSFLNKRLHADEMVIVSLNTSVEPKFRNR